MARHAHYYLLAGLFDFPATRGARGTWGIGDADPGAEYTVRGQELPGVLRENYPDAADEVRRFMDGIPSTTRDLQELHTRTFDVQSITTLDIGYVLFGDDYKRAELLSNLTREHRLVENDCGRELADHLPNLLRLIPRLADQELLAELVGEILVPALMLMIREFDPERIQKKNANYRKHYKTLIESPPGSDATIYCRALKALLHVLTTDFHVTEVVARLSALAGSRKAADFLGLVQKELEIEENANPANSGCDS